MIAGYIEKTPLEVFTFSILYEGRLPPSATVSSSAVSCKNASTGVVDNSLIGSTMATIDANKAKIVVLAGIATNDYFITFLTTLSDGSVFEDVVVLKVSA